MQTIIWSNHSRFRNYSPVSVRCCGVLPSSSRNICASRIWNSILSGTRRRARAVPLNLTPKEFLLLAHLVRSGGAVVSRDEIAEHVWDVGFTTDTNVVDVVVRRLRSKVDDPFKTKLIHTIRGVGYVLKGR